MKNAYLRSAAVLALVLLTTGHAAAEAPFTANAPSVFGELGYGVWIGDAASDINAYGAGLSLGGGYTLDMGLYLGGRFDYYLGDSQRELGVEVSSNIYQFGLEAGYDLGLGRTLVLRPQLGLGVGTVTADGGAVAFVRGPRRNLAVTPGLALLYDFGGVHVRGELRYNIFSVDTPSDVGSRDASGLLIGVGAGLAF